MTLRELPGGGALGAVRHHRAGLLPAQQPKPITDRGVLQGAEKIVTSRLLSDWGIPELTCCRGLLGPRGHIPPHTHTSGLLLEGSQAPPSIPRGFSEHSDGSHHSGHRDVRFRAVQPETTS